MANVKNKNLKNRKLGTYPDLSLADAREMASEVRKLAKKGEDFFNPKSLDSEGVIFEDFAKDYIEKHAKPNKRQWRTDERLIKKELNPKWGSLRVKEITRKNVVEILDDFIARNAPTQGNRVRSLISKIFNWGIDEEYISYNPCHKVKKRAKEKARARVLTQQEIKKLWREMLNPHVSGIIKLMLLTAQRRWEISRMRRRDIDFDSGWWTIPGEFAKNGKSHQVPLTKAALEIIKYLPQGKNQGNDHKFETDWIFPSPTRKGQFIDNIQKAKQRLDDAANVDNFVLHDLRRTAATIMGQEGIPGNIIGKVLNHAEHGVTQIYNRHPYDKEKRDALEVLERKLKKIIGQSLSIRNYDPTGETVFEALDLVRKSQGMPE